MLYKLVCCISAAEVAAAEVATDGVLPEGCWTLGAVKLGVRHLVKRSYWGLMLLSWGYGAQ